MRASWLSVAGVVAVGLLGGCGSDEGAYCCNCLCCGASVTLTRDDQSWPNCDDPCRASCEVEVGCHEMVELAEPCPDEG